jgi:peptidoglycan/xylan/chitin deacetylase (PgdA/CDA1 family)
MYLVSYMIYLKRAVWMAGLLGLCFLRGSEPTKRVLDMLDEFDVKATFFVVADVVEHYLGLVESIVERGHEIGCHESRDLS